jgi:Flp pilus assembly protein TadD
MLAEIFQHQGKTEETIAHYKEALRLKPEWPEVLNNLAWLLATHPKAQFRNGDQAVRLARRACDLTKHQQPIYLGTLAAAYAEAGNFERAIESAQQAHDLAARLGQQILADRNRELLEIYRARKPYRQTGPHEP